MSRGCSICEQYGAEDINALLLAGKSVREVSRDFGIPRATLGRHAEHIKAGHSVDSGPPADEGGSLPGTQLAAARELIVSVRDRLGDDYGAQDIAEAEHLTALAELVDSNPTNISALRELRLTNAEFRRVGTPIDEDGEAYAELVAELSSSFIHIDAFNRVYKAAIASGASEETALAAAHAVNPPEPEPVDWHEAMARRGR
jgi:hypothetical protein